MLFSLRMEVLLHKEFKNIEVEFLKVSEKIWSPGFPDIRARKSWDFLILTVSASTVTEQMNIYCLSTTGYMFVLRCLERGLSRVWKGVGLLAAHPYPFW